MAERTVPDLGAVFDRWFDYPRASTPRLAHDGATVYLVSDRGGLPHAWSVPRSGGLPTHYFGSGERVAQIVPRPDAAGTIVAIDRGGDEHYQLLLVDERGEVRRTVTDAPDRIHRPGAWDDRGNFYFTSNARDLRFFDVYAFDPRAAGPPRVVREEDALIDAVDARGDRRLLLRSNTNIDRDALLDGNDGTVNLLPHDDEVAIFDAAIGPDRVYLAANPDREWAAVVATRFTGAGPETLVSYDGDVERLALDRSGRTLALVFNDRGYGRLAVLDLDRAESRDVDLPHAGVVGSLAMVPDGSEVVFDLSSPELGTEVFAATVATGRVRRLSHASRPFPGPPVSPRLFEVGASDGVRVPFWWYEPSAPARATIVYVHGGPESQSRPSFVPLFGFLLEQGFRLVVPNVRGSLGYGRTYLHLDDRRRRMDSVRDLMELVRAVRDGRTPVPCAPAERIGVIGGSYGGFMVLASIATYPELFDAAVDIVGISNFVTFLERTASWRRKVREDEYGSLAHDRAFLEEISPLHRADRITTPLLVVHGENDPRVPLYEAEQIVRALRGRGVAVDLLRYANEGHGLVRRENQREAYLRAAAFFEHHLAAGARTAP